MCVILKKTRRLLPPCLFRLRKRRKSKSSDEDLTVYERFQQRQQRQQGFCHRLFSYCLRSKNTETLYPLESVHINIEEIGNT